MDDYINLKTKLELGKYSDIRFTGEKDIDNLESININRNLSKPERILNFIRTVKNPYIFMVNGIKVKFEYSNGGPNICECFENVIKNKNM